VGKRGWIVAVILAGLMVVGVGGGVILAHGGKGGGGLGKGGDNGTSLAVRVAEILEMEASDVTDAFESVKESWDKDTDFIAEAAEILGVEESELEDALTQAGREMANEAVRARMDAMVEKELISQEEADGYIEWFEDRPEFLDRGGWMKGTRMHRGASRGDWRGGHHRGKRGGGLWDKDMDRSEPSDEEDSSTSYTES